MEQSRTKRLRRKTPLFFLLPSLAAGALIGHALVAPDARAYFQNDPQLMYFRVRTPAQCNVYMDYSVLSPTFSLKARNPRALNDAQRRFLRDFNQAFHARVAPLLRACVAPLYARMLPRPRQQELLDRCTRIEEGLGLSQAGWNRSRLPAPSNCIWPKLTPAGTMNLVEGPLPETEMSIGQWMARARGGR